MPIEQELQRLREMQVEDDQDYSARICELEQQRRQLQEQIFDNLTAWQKVLLARHPKRPYTLDYVSLMLDEFIELHGDRRYGDDRAIVAGLGILDGLSIAVVGHQKGRTTRERRERNFGSAHPEGYRKAQRVMELAERIGAPVVTLIDTPAAACLQDAEARGISEAIATSQLLMSRLCVPVVVAITGEGGSGGAIAIGVGDRVLMMQYAMYSVIPPESFASIYWNDPSYYAEAAEAAKLTAEDALRLGVVDEVIKEPLGGAHADPTAAATNLKEAILRHLRELLLVSGDELVRRRYEKFRAMGQYAQ